MAAEQNKQASVISRTGGPGPSLRMMADTPLGSDDDDRLHFKSYANALAGVIDRPETTTPISLGINAPWGAGKTSLGLMIKRRLEQKASAGGHRPHVTCWFDAWLYDDAPNLASAFTAHVARVAERNRPLWRKVANPIPSELLTKGEVRSRLLLVLLNLFLLSLVFCQWLFPALPRQMLDAKSLKQLVQVGIQPASTFGFIYALLMVLAKLLTKTSEAGKSIRELVKNPSSAANRGEIEEARGQLGRLIRQATPNGSRFVIFVDDLDRCRPQRSVEILEVVSQLLAHQGVVTVLMGDMTKIAAAVDVKYAKMKKTLSGASGTGIFGRTYLQKIIQLQFDIPPCRHPTLRTLLADFARPRSGKMGTPKEPFRRRFMTGRSADLSLKVYMLALGARNTFALWISHRLTALSTRMWRARIDDLVAEQTKDGPVDLARVEYCVTFEVVMNATGLSRLLIGPATFALIKERVQRYLENESEIQREAEQRVMEFLPRLPRHAKRLLNRLRLLLFIAHERRMFDPLTGVSPAHMAKWAVLMERWPEFAERVWTKPATMRAAELCSEDDVRWGETVKLLATWLVDDADFREFCRSHVAIGPVMEQLVAFELEEAAGKAN